MRKGMICLLLLVASCVLAGTPKSQKFYRNLGVGTATIIDSVSISADPDTLTLDDNLSRKSSLYGCVFKIQTTTINIADACTLIIGGLSPDTTIDTIIHTSAGNLWSDSTTYTKVYQVICLGARVDTDSVYIKAYVTNINIGESDAPFDSVWIENPMFSVSVDSAGYADSSGYSDSTGAYAVAWDTLGAYLDTNTTRIDTSGYSDTSGYAQTSKMGKLIGGGMSNYRFTMVINTHSSVPYLVLDNKHSSGDSMLLYISSTGRGDPDEIKVVMPDSIALTAGTARVPVENYVYYHYNAGSPALLKSATLIEHTAIGQIPDSLVSVGHYFLGAASASDVEVRIFNDYRNVLNKHMVKTLHRLRYKTSYEDGIDITMRGKSFAIGSGLVLQATHTYIPAIDNRDPHQFISPIFSDSAYATWDSLSDFYEYSDGTAIGAVDELWIVFWVSASEDSNETQLYINLQAGTETFTKAIDCEQAIYMMPLSFPDAFSETGCLLCAGIWTNQGDSMVTLSDGSKYKDLRGISPAVAGGAGAPATDSTQIAIWGFMDNTVDTNYSLTWTRDSDSLSITDGAGTKYTKIQSVDSCDVADTSLQSTIPHSAISDSADVAGNSYTLQTKDTTYLLDNVSDTVKALTFATNTLTLTQETGGNKTVDLSALDDTGHYDPDTDVDSIVWDRASDKLYIWEDGLRDSTTIQSVDSSDYSINADTSDYCTDTNDIYISAINPDSASENIRFQKNIYVDSIVTIGDTTYTECRLSIYGDAIPLGWSNIRGIKSIVEMEEASKAIGGYFASGVHAGEDTPFVYNDPTNEYGLTANNFGVVGIGIHLAGHQSIGVYGDGRVYTGSESGIGVYGIGRGDISGVGKKAIGGYFRADTTTHGAQYGVYAEADTYGIYAKSPGYAGYFDGNVFGTKNATFDTIIGYHKGYADTAGVASDLISDSKVVDISTETNLTASGGVTLTGDNLTADLGTTIESGEITDGTIAEVDLKIVDSPTDEDILTYESTTGDFEWHSKNEIAGTLSRSFVIQAIDVNHDFAFWMTRDAITLVKVSGLCKGGTNVVGVLMEYDANGANPVVCNSSDWTFTTGEEETTSLSNASIDAGDYLGWKTTSVSGTVDFFTLTFEYIKN